MPDPTQNPVFNVQAARAAGYSDDEIIQHLSESRGFDVQGALKNGYQKEDLINYLSSTPAKNLPVPPKPITGSPGIDTTLRNVRVPANQPQPQPGAYDQLTQGIKQNPGILDAIKESIYHPQGFQALRNVLAYAGSKGQEQADAIRRLGESGVISPTTAGVASYPGLFISSTGRIASEQATPTNAALAAASVVNRPLRLAVSAYGAATSGKGIYDSLTDESVPLEKRLENFFLSGAGLTGSAALAGAKTPKAPLTTSEAASQIRDAVNPAPQIADKFQQGTAAQLPDVLKTAAEKKIDVSNSSGLSQAFKTWGRINGEQYHNALNEASPKAGTFKINNYGGEVSGEGGATLKQLNDRLEVINAELKPDFDKGLRGANAAVKSEPELRAEAANIRSVLYREISRQTGIAPEEIARVNQNFGQSMDVANRIDQRISETRHATVAREQGQSVPKSLTEVAFRGLEAAKTKVMGKPMDRGIAKAVSSILPETPSATETISNVPRSAASESRDIRAAQAASARGGSTRYINPSPSGFGTAAVPIEESMNTAAQNVFGKPYEKLSVQQKGSAQLIKETIRLHMKR